jgi:hypothetical protein
MQVTIDRKRVKLTDRDVIGVGGEATVFRHKGQAVKIYAAPTPERGQKLKAMSALPLPSAVIAPQEVVYDANGRCIVGFTMRLLDAGYSEVRKLATKNARAQMGISGRDVALLYLNAHGTLRALHQAGVIVGDLNDLNLMFGAGEVAYIDADSFQFSAYPCIVGTEAFLDPALYGIDLSKGRAFKPENDWYSFAVLLFKSLLLAHPYGGVHPSLNLLTQRAQARVSVLDSAVQYPRIAYPPDILSDDLAQAFQAIFTQGKRDVFPETALQDYADHLTICPSCGITYPSNRARCPVCSTVQPISNIPMAIARTLLNTNGAIVAWAVSGETIRAVVYENNRAVLYTVMAHGSPRRTELFDALPNAQYAFMGDLLVVMPGQGDTLFIVDTSCTVAQGIHQTTTGLYSGRTPIFGTNDHALYRLAGGFLMRGAMHYGQWTEQTVLAISEGQTWLCVAPDADRVFGYFRVTTAPDDPSLGNLSNDYRFWLLDEGKRVQVSLPPLDAGEMLLDVEVKFASSSLVVARHTSKNGTERVRLDEIDLSGRVLNSFAGSADEFEPLAAHAYAKNVALLATDSGVVQMKLDGSGRRTFTQTEPFVQRGNVLHPYLGGLLAISEKRIVHLQS